MGKTQRSRRRRRRWLAAAGAAALAAWGVVGCSPERPSAPSTEFTISIPVANDSTRIHDVVGDRRSFLSTDPTSGGMRVHFSKDVGTAQVGDRLRARPTENTFRAPIGVFRIPGQSLPPVDLSLASLIPDLPVLGTVPIPSASINAAADLGLDNVSSVKVETGSFELSVRNGLPVALQNLSLTLYDRGRSQVVDVLQLGTLAANGGAGTGTLSLAGKDISGALEVRVTGATVATDAAAVGGSPSLRVAASMSDLTVLEATARIPEQQFSDHQVLAFPDTRVLVTRAKISQGGLTMIVRNDIPLIVEVDLALDDLRRPDGQTNTFRISGLSPGVARTIRFDLVDNEFAPPNPEELRLSFAVRTAPSDQKVTLTSGGEVSIEVQTDDLVFSEVRGRLNGVRLPMPGVERQVDFPDGLDNVHLADAALDVYVTSGIAFLADVDLGITGTNARGEVSHISMVERFERGSPTAPTRHVLTAKPAELVSFLNSLPTRIQIEPEVRLGDGLAEETVAAEHWVSVDSVVFVSSSRLAVVEPTQIDPEPRNITFRDSQTRTRVNSNFRRALVMTEIENALPFQVGVRLFVARSKEHVYDPTSADFVTAIPSLDEEPFHADAPAIDAQGHSQGSARTQRNLELTRDDILKFILEDRDRGQLWSGVRVYFPATAGVVEIRDLDYVNTVAALKVELLLDKNLVE